MINNLQEFIKDNLRIKNVSPHIIEKTNTLIDMAIWELKRNQVIPPITLEFDSLDRKEEKRNNDNSLKYNYYFLPKDFDSLEEFFVDDADNPPEDSFETSRRVPYQYTAYDNSIDLAKTTGKRKFFTITDITFDGENRKILIANPFPKDDVRVVIKYYEDGTDALVDRLDDRYWKAILREIEGEIGVRPLDLVIDERNNEISRSKNQQGKDKLTNTAAKVKGTFFKGRSYEGRNFHKRYWN